MDKIKAWFNKFIHGLQAAFTQVTHLPIVEPVFELLSEQRTLIALTTFGIDYGLTQWDIPQAYAVIGLAVVSVVGTLMFQGKQREVLLEIAALKPPTREELENIIAAAIKVKLAAGVG